MPDTTTLIVFLIASVLFLVTPGPAVLYIVTRSFEQGRFAGIMSTFGIATGSCIHVFAAALGLSALLASSALAFSVLKYLGAGYLIYLGIRCFVARETVRSAMTARPTTTRVFLDGVVVQVLNPKISLFFLAFLPQFVDVSRNSIVIQFFLLGFTFVALGIVTDGTYAFVASLVRRWLGQNAGKRSSMRYLTGGVLIGLGATAALTDGGRK